MTENITDQEDSQATSDEQIESRKQEIRSRLAALYNVIPYGQKEYNKETLTKNLNEQIESRKQEIDKKTGPIYRVIRPYGRHPYKTDSELDEALRNQEYDNDPALDELTRTKEYLLHNRGAETPIIDTIKQRIKELRVNIDSIGSTPPVVDTPKPLPELKFTFLERLRKALRFFPPKPNEEAVGQRKNEIRSNENLKEMARNRGGRLRGGAGFLRGVAASAFGGINNVSARIEHKLQPKSVPTGLRGAPRPGSF